MNDKQKPFDMLNLKVGREWEQRLQEVHDLPMFGLETYVKWAETVVTSEESDAAPQHLGVWGMGGVGKTLLLRRLYWSPKIRGHFKGAKFIWCTVGQTPDIMALYRNLSEELGFKPESNLNAEDYKLKLQSLFGEKRVFLVLDDVWHNKAFKLLDIAKGRGSVTLLSSRDQSLLERASPQIRQKEMTPLSEEDSRSLFFAHAFRSPSNVPSELVALARCMADECGGLPLALKVIGEVMFGETLPEQWKFLLKKLRESRMHVMTVKEELYERLKHGYDLLSEDDWRLKDCFLHFAAFPEDSSIDFEYILWHWIGEGLVPGNRGDDPRADAMSLLNKLWRRSFIQVEEEVDSVDGYFLSFSLHDVMRDLALYIIENDSGTRDRGTRPAKQLYLYRAGHNLEEVPEECRTLPDALKLSLDTNKLERLPESFYAPKLVSLLLGGNSIVSLPGSFLWSFEELRVLDLHSGEFDSLPDEVGDLKNLVWLNLSWCIRLKIVPDTVGKLQLLKNLNLSHCHSLTYLPSTLVAVTSLQVLNTSRCKGLRWAAYGRSLDHYQTMDMSEDHYQTMGASLEDICGLFSQNFAFLEEEL
jgi:hypothetical protein